MMEILPLLVFTTFGGAAAGAYVLAVYRCVCAKTSADAAESAPAERPWLFPLVGIVLLVIGLLGTLSHLGQPLRFMNGMSNPASMISQESYWAIAFGVLMVVDLAIAKVKGVSAFAVQCLAAIAACGLMVVTGLAYEACSFLPAWATAITVPLFIVGDLAMGAGVCLALERVDAAADTLHTGSVAVSLAWLAVVVGYAVHLAGIGADVAIVAAGAIVGPVACAVVSALALQGKLPAKLAGYVVLALAAIGVLLVRGAFFAAGVL